MPLITMIFLSIVLYNQFGWQMMVAYLAIDIFLMAIKPIWLGAIVQLGERIKKNQL